MGNIDYMVDLRVLTWIYIYWWRTGGETSRRCIPERLDKTWRRNMIDSIQFNTAWRVILIESLQGVTSEGIADSSPRHRQFITSQGLRDHRFTVPEFTLTWRYSEEHGRILTWYSKSPGTWFIFRSHFAKLEVHATHRSAL